MIIEQTDKYSIESQSVGIVIYRKFDNAECFIQGEGATIWLDEYAAVQKAYSNPESAWHKRTWNDCLSQICDDYLNVKGN